MDPKTKYKLFKQNDNFCVCPWTNAEIFTNGDVKTCSVGKEIIGNVNETDITELLQKSDTLKRIRANMLENRPDPNCTVCQFRTIESNEFTYLKDHYNSRIVNEEVDYSDVENFDLRFIDLHWSNICNLRCVFCHPGQSSLIAKDENVIVKPVNDNNIEKIKSLIVEKQDSIKEIYLSGGEPFYIPHNFSLLEQITNKDVPIRINTNMHWQTNNRVFKALQEFNNVQLTMSVDALYDKFGYIRNGADWDTFINNLQYVKQNTKFSLRVNSVFSVINAIDICETVEYFLNIGIDDITINLLTSPSEIDAKNYPKDKKQKVIDKIEALVQTIPIGNKNLIGNLKNCVARLQLENTHNYESCLDSITRKHEVNWRTIFKDLV